MSIDFDIKKRCIVVAVFYPKPGKTEAIKEILTEVIPAVHQEPGCDFYALHELPDGRLCFVEAWKTRDDWVRHGDAETVLEINQRTADLIAKPVEVLEMYGVPAGGDLGIVPIAK